MNKKILLLLFHTIILGQGSITVYDQKYKVEITRDEWGVPHVHGKTDADAAFGLAYAHAQDDFENTSSMDVFGEPQDNFNEDASIYAEETDVMNHYEDDEFYSPDGTPMDDPNAY